MPADALFLRLNVALALATLLVLALRLPARRLFGPRVAYGLWLLPLLAAFTALFPARLVTEVRTAPPGEIHIAPSPSFEAPSLLPWLWLLGAALSFAWIVRRQRQFARAERGGRAGPAVVGVLKPRIVTPADFEVRYSPIERRLILAHEQAHIARHDPRANALTAAARCLAWFNPMAHVLARFLRIDQELACDAQVAAAHPHARRTYAEAMLKAQLAARPLPLGCDWRPAGPHPLAQRIAWLARPPMGPRRERLGGVALVIISVASLMFAWASRPTITHVRFVAAPTRAAAVRHSEAPAQAPSGLEPSERKPTAIAAAPAETTAPAEAAPQLELVSLAEPPFTRRIRAASRRSHIQPGYAVRVVARMIDPDGIPLVTDLTAFGSQSDYRTGYFDKTGSRYALFTAVDQDGDDLRVTASLGGRFWPDETGTLAMRPGETRELTLPNGQVVHLTAVLRPETSEEQADARWQAERDDRPRLIRTASRDDPFRCGRPGAIC